MLYFTVVFAKPFCFRAPLCEKTMATPPLNSSPDNHKAAIAHCDSVNVFYGVSHYDEQSFLECWRRHKSTSTELKDKYSVHKRKPFLNRLALSPPLQTSQPYFRSSQILSLHLRLNLLSGFPNKLPYHLEYPPLCFKFLYMRGSNFMWCRNLIFIHYIYVIQRKKWIIIIISSICIRYITHTIILGRASRK